jgi:hypothetical protein
MKASVAAGGDWQATMSVVGSSSLTLRTLLLLAVEAHHPCTPMPFTCMKQQFLFPLKVYKMPLAILFLFLFLFFCEIDCRRSK